ncbi:hypothetical protein PACTADRAFT_14171 [Pachysolen tannophilus NRRL Y-2460]|uniref:Uncharacterized protein n=1 Tax=Pachysolen tannophilus NRRL Y-2460 TaxID=669874 RepID=A0A1E4U0V2_PACTA|nr:hypothetical protein PACTADRAFT_14171 [Pachysolen tannophilus NRRL Y-2460]
MSFRPQPARVWQNAINTPTKINVLSSESIDNEEVLLLLDNYLSSATSLDNNSINNATTATTLSQLKRCQRELRGFAPMLMDDMRVQNSGNGGKTHIKDFNTTGSNTKIIFDTEELGAQAEHTKIDKEERKRLKKERRKQEKLEKLNKTEVEADA